MIEGVIERTKDIVPGARERIHVRYALFKAQQANEGTESAKLASTEDGLDRGRITANVNGERRRRNNKPTAKTQRQARPEKPKKNSSCFYNNRTLMSLSFRTAFQCAFGRLLSVRSQTSFTICSAVSMSKQQFFLYERGSSHITVSHPPARKQMFSCAYRNSSKMRGTVSRHFPSTSQPAMITGQVNLVERRRSSKYARRQSARERIEKNCIRRDGGEGDNVNRNRTHSTDIPIWAALSKLRCRISSASLMMRASPRGTLNTWRRRTI